MPYCKKCGSELNEQTRFCPKCGTSVNQQQPQFDGIKRNKHFPIALIAILACVLIFSLVLFPLLLSQWNPLGIIVGSGNPTTQNHQFVNFNSISISSGFTFVIEQAKSYSVETTIDENLQNYVQISKSGDILSVELKSGYSISASTLKVKISMPSLSRLELSGGVNGNATGFVSTNDFEIEASGGSRIYMQGQAGNLKVNASAGSQLNLANFAVSNANVELSGGSQTEIRPSGKIDANLSGGSRLFYSGNPTIGNINISGGATIEKR